MIRTIFRVAMLAWAFALVWPTAASALQRIPFTEVNGGLIQVQGSIDGRPQVPMLVDLGAGLNVLSQRVGAPLVNVTGKYVSLRLTGERVDLPIGSVVSLTLGDFRVDPPDVGLWNGLDGSGVDGLISATAFRNIVTTFDFRNHELLIEDAQTFPERRRVATRVPLVLQDDFGIALGLFARFDLGNGQSALCEIDTGKQGITIDKRLAPKLGVNLNDGQTKHTIASLSLIDAPQTKMNRPEVAFGDLIHDCNVGNVFWAGKIFTLDILNRAVYVAISP